VRSWPSCARASRPSKRVDDAAGRGRRAVSGPELDIGVDTSVASAFPSYRALALVARSVVNRASTGASRQLLDAASQRARHELDGRAPSELPEIAAWREAFSRFGAKPSRYPSSTEALLTRVAGVRAFEPDSPRPRRTRTSSSRRCRRQAQLASRPQRTSSRRTWRTPAPCERSSGSRSAAGSAGFGTLHRQYAGRPWGSRSGVRAFTTFPPSGNSWTCTSTRGSCWTSRR
jgi:hypothetical protein